MPIGKAPPSRSYYPRPLLHKPSDPMTGPVPCLADSWTMCFDDSRVQFNPPQNSTNNPDNKTHWVYWDTFHNQNIYEDSLTFTFDTNVTGSFTFNGEFCLWNSVVLIVISYSGTAIEAYGWWLGYEPPQYGHAEFTLDEMPTVITTDIYENTTTVSYGDAETFSRSAGPATLLFSSASQPLSLGNHQLAFKNAGYFMAFDYFKVYINPAGITSTPSASQPSGMRCWRSVNQKTLIIHACILTSPLRNSSLQERRPNPSPKYRSALPGQLPPWSLLGSLQDGQPRSLLHLLRFTTFEDVSISWRNSRQISFWILLRVGMP